MGKLVDKLESIMDGYYGGSDNHKELCDILYEVEFLYTRGILAAKKLGRIEDIVKQAMK